MHLPQLGAPHPLLALCPRPVTIPWTVATPWTAAIPRVAAIPRAAVVVPTVVPEDTVLTHEGSDEMWIGVVVAYFGLIRV